MLAQASVARIDVHFQYGGALVFELDEGGGALMC